jgi:hypothetical protein
MATTLPLMVEHLAERGLRKLAINVPHEFNVADFRSDRAGTLFEKASIDPPLGVEEMWFDSLESQLFKSGRPYHEPKYS